MLTPSIKTLLGFANKSAGLLAGEAAVEAGLKRRKAALVLNAADIPAKRQEILAGWCEEIGVPHYILGTKEEYGAALGMSPRGTIAVTDKQMAKAIIKQIEKEKAD